MKIKRYIYPVLATLLIVALAVLEIFRGSLFEANKYGEYMYSVLSRLVGGTACVFLLLMGSLGRILGVKTTFKKMLVFLPCMAVAVNNFPFIPFFSKQAYINSSVGDILLYALVCLGVGFFEEMAFRGCIFTVILRRVSGKRADVFLAIALSSAVFGAVHLVNVFVGASLGGVLLQVGYSFLIGAMCSVVLVKTGNIWYCVVLHAVYNFAGGVVPECGGGLIWTPSEIALTAIIGVAVAAYVIYTLVTITPKEKAELLNEPQKQE